MLGMKQFFYKKFISPFTGPSKLLNNTNHLTDTKGLMIWLLYIKEFECRYNKTKADKRIDEELNKLIPLGNEKDKEIELSDTKKSDSDKEIFNWDKFFHDFIYCPRVMVGLPFMLLACSIKLGENYLDNAIEKSDSCMQKGGGYFTKYVLFFLRLVCSSVVAVTNIPEIFITPPFKAVKELVLCCISDNDNKENSLDHSEEVTTTVECTNFLELQNIVTSHLSKRQQQDKYLPDHVEKQKSIDNVDVMEVITEASKKDDNDGFIFCNYKISKTTISKGIEITPVSRKNIDTAMIGRENENNNLDNGSQLQDTISDAKSLRDVLSVQNTVDTDYMTSIYDNELIPAYCISNLDSSEIVVTPDNDSLEIIYDDNTNITSNNIETLGSDEENGINEFS